MIIMQFFYEVMIGMNQIVGLIVTNYMYLSPSKLMIH